MAELQPVVLCGGNGTRLWPLSREQYPKQFLALGHGEHSMLQQTLLRLKGLSPKIPVAPPIVVCNAEHRFLAAQQLQEIGITNARIILEPQGKNTAPALTLAALQCTPDAVLLAMPADHLLEQLSPWHDAVALAWRAAQAGAMLTFGVEATRAETGYGYIRKGPATAEQVFQIDGFAEKPNQALAQEYIDSGAYLWNSGMFMVQAQQWLHALASLQPAILQHCQNAVYGSRQDMDFIRPDPSAFGACPSDSIDYAVMEHLPQRSDLGVPAQVVPLRAGWSDLGAWDALWEALPQDAQGNASHGNTLAVDTHNSLLYAESCLIAAVGVTDLVVVETADAILIADKSRTQDVKKIVGTLKSQNRNLVTTHRKVHRPWGWYDSVDRGERFQVKRITVNPGAQLSLQKHHHRAEHWVVVSGTAEVTRGDEVFLLAENQSTYIPLGQIHRLRNPGKVPLELIEVQSGSYLGEDDIVRLDSNY